jgi:hypothetical protein
MLRDVGIREAKINLSKLPKEAQKGKEDHHRPGKKNCQDHRGR